MLRIAGVELGKHSFSIVCDDKFFELANFEDIQNGMLHLKINMEKSETMMHLSFHFKGNVTVPCDRCLDPVTMPLNFKEKLIVKFISLPEDNSTEDDMIWTISENEYELDVFHFVYESISLALPTQIIHPDDEKGESTCNPDILKRLEELSRKEDPETDPRWDALKNIDLKEN